MKLFKQGRTIKYLYKNFGAIFALKCFFLRCISFQRYERFIYDYLSGFFAPVIEEYKNKGKEKYNKANSKNKVWTLWWQGEDEAPEIVRVCIESQRTAFSKIGADVVVLDKKNWNEYIDLPSHILEKVENGSITLTHFSDIIRATLLSQYGGLWIDATVYCTKPISDSRILQSFFTVKTHKSSDSLTLRRWTGFLIGDCAGSQLFSFMRECFSFYWKQKNALVAYLLIDYTIAIAVENFQEVRNAFESVPENNTKIWSMLRKLNQPYDSLVWKEIKRNTTFLKLSYKDEFNGGALRERTKKGDLTNWGYIKGLAEQEYL